MKDHEHDWSEPAWAVYCSDCTCDVTLEDYLAKLQSENAAMREVLQVLAQEFPDVRETFARLARDSDLWRRYIGTPAR